MTDVDRQALNLDVPTALIAELDREAESRGMYKYEVLSEALRVFLGMDTTDDRAVLGQAIKRHDREIRRLRAERDDLDSRIQELEDRRDSLEADLGDLDDQLDDYDDVLDDLLDQLAKNDFRAIALTKNGLEDAARSKFGRPTESNIQKVIGDMRDRAAANDLEIAPWKWDPSLPKSGNRNPVTAAADGGTTDVGGRP